jgi:hypothetical protein
MFSKFPADAEKLFSMSHCCLLSPEAFLSGQKLCSELWSKKQPAFAAKDIADYEFKDNAMMYPAQTNEKNLPRAEDVLGDGNCEYCCFCSFPFQRLIKRSKEKAKKVVDQE